MSTVVYDAAVLVAADRNERRAWAEHKARLELGVVPLVPAPVVAQVSRSPQQAQLRRFLTGCVVVPLGQIEAHEAGRLLGMTKTSDVVDAVVVTIALRRHATILTSDPDDIERLVRASGRQVAVVAISGIAGIAKTIRPGYVVIEEVGRRRRRRRLLPPVGEGQVGACGGVRRPGENLGVLPGTRSVEPRNEVHLQIEGITVI